MKSKQEEQAALRSTKSSISINEQAAQNSLLENLKGKDLISYIRCIGEIHMDKGEKEASVIVTGYSTSQIEDIKRSLSKCSVKIPTVVVVEFTDNPGFPLICKFDKKRTNSEINSG